MKQITAVIKEGFVFSLICIFFYLILNICVKPEFNVYTMQFQLLTRLLSSDMKSAK